MSLAPGAAQAETTGERVYFGPVATAKPAPGTFFSAGGMHLAGECEALAGDDVDLNITLETDVDNSQVYFNAHSGGDSAAYESDGVDVGDVVTITDFLGMDDNAVGQIVFSRPDGRHVTVDWFAIEEPIYAADRCVFAGSAQVAKPGVDGPLSRDRIDFRADAGKRRTVLDARGLHLTARCDALGSLQVFAETTVDHATIHANSQHVTGVGTDDPYYADDNNFRPDERFNMTNRILASDSNGGQIVYATPAGAVVTVDWGAEEGAYGELDRDCALYGTARTLGDGAADRLAYRAPAGSPAETFYDRGGLRLRGRCADPADMSVEMRVVEPSHGASGAQLFDDEISFRAFGTTKVPLGAFFVLGEDRVVGQTVYVEQDRDVHTFDWLAEELNAFGGGPACAFFGSSEYFPRP